MDYFLLNIKSRIRKSEEGDLIIKCNFSLDNVEPFPSQNEALIVNSRYWSTKAYHAKLFNEYIYFNLGEGKLKRVINNGSTSSSWHFNRFLYFNVKILDSVSLIFW